MIVIPAAERARLTRQAPWLASIYSLELVFAIGALILASPLSRLLIWLIVTHGILGLLGEVFVGRFLSRWPAPIYVSRYLLIGLFPLPLLALTGDPGWLLLALVPASAAAFLISLTIGARAGAVSGALLLGSFWGVSYLYQHLDISHLAFGAVLLGGAVVFARLTEHRFQAEGTSLEFSDLIGFENVAEAVVVVDAGQRVFYLNPAASRLLEWSNDRARSLPLGSVVPLTVPGKSLAEQAVFASQTGNAVQGKGVLDMRESSRTLHFSISPLPEKRGALILLRDVSDEVRLRHRQQDFAATISHELRTPLAATEGYLELIRNTENLPERARTTTEKALSSIGHMGALLEEFLKSAQADEGSLRAVVRKPVELAPIVKEVIDEFTPQAEARGIKLSLGQPESGASFSLIPPVLGEATRIREILENLVGNALKFTERGSVTLSVTSYPRTVTIAISDTGIGISPQDQKRIFEEFFRAGEYYTRPQGGAGLGLFITRSLVESLGGKVKVRSTPGQGTTILVTLLRIVS